MADQFLGELEQLAMLAIIKLGEEAYGTSVRDAIEEHTGRAVSIGSLYKSFERLECKGFVHSELGAPTPERGGRAKKFVAVTSKGRIALRDSLRGINNLVETADQSLVAV